MEWKYVDRTTGEPRDFDVEVQKPKDWAKGRPGFGFEEEGRWNREKNERTARKFWA